jgi:hypothetical protein
MEYEKEINIWEKALEKYVGLAGDAKSEGLKKSFQRTVEKIKHDLSRLKNTKKNIEEASISSSVKYMHGNNLAMLFFADYLAEKYPDFCIYEVNLKKALDEYKQTKGNLDLKVIHG